MGSDWAILKVKGKVIVKNRRTAVETNYIVFCHQRP